MAFVTIFGSIYDFLSTFLESVTYLIPWQDAEIMKSAVRAWDFWASTPRGPSNPRPSVTLASRAAVVYEDK